jgi:hypothetical protein
MTEEDDSAAAEAGLREKLNQLEADLDRTLRLREETESSIEELTERTRELTDRHGQLLKQEGRLRGQIGDVQRSLEALQSQ